MATSRVPATIDALFSLLETAGVPVIDGPLVTSDPSDAVFIGYDGDPDGDFQAAESDQEWIGIGALTREEKFHINCAAVVTVGDGNVKLARDTAYALTATVENELRSDPSLGLGPPASRAFIAGFNGGPMFCEPSPIGYQVRVVFQIHVKTQV
jgi:hypothetical protein